MARKGIREYDAKRILSKGLSEYSNGKFSIDKKRALVTPDTDLSLLEKDQKWLLDTKLVVKPDQLFGKRGKNNLLLLDADWKLAKEWILARMNKETTIHQTTGSTEGIITHFLIEPFVKHQDEYYLAIVQGENADEVHFSTKGGVDIESVWDSVVTFSVPVLDGIDNLDVIGKLPEMAHKDIVADFIKIMYKVFDEYYFTYLELNPFSVMNDEILFIDTVAKLDNTASYQCAEKWGKVDFPKPFGSIKMPEEEYVADLDERTGASLKLTILNPLGRIWNLVAGGGASVIYADTVVDLGEAEELANYGEYSGNPTTELTYEYTKTLLDLMTRAKDPLSRSKYLIIGGGIANFTDVAKTFTGIIKAIEDYQDKLKEVDAKIFVRRGGPNYKEGLALMRKLGERTGIPTEVYGPETHMTRIVSLALKGGE